MQGKKNLLLIAESFENRSIHRPQKFKFFEAWFDSKSFDCEHVKPKQNARKQRDAF